MSHGEGGWENFRSRSSSSLITNATKRCNALNSMKAQTISTWQSQSFLLETEIKAGSEQRTQIKECIGKKCRQLFVSLTKVN